MYTIGDLKKEFKLSRSSILYYDKIGLLKPSARSSSNYRLYSEKDKERLKIILQYREAGISLENIAKLLTINRSSISDILTERLAHIQEEIKLMKKQERIIIESLTKEVSNSEKSSFNNVTWSNMLTGIGYTDEDLYQWHRDFEEDSPKKHTAFLKALGLNDENIRTLRNKIKSLT